MNDAPGDSGSPDWFRALLDSTPDVYFRYRLSPPRRFDYLSPSVAALTGHRAEAFQADPALCLGVVTREDRRLLRQILRASRGLTLRLTIRRGRTTVPVDVHTVAIVSQRKVVAIEGVVRSLEWPLFTETARQESRGAEPTQQRLVALMGEVHALLHRVLPPAPDAAAVLHLGQLAFDLDRLSVTESGAAVALTNRELRVLRYLLLHAGRVITRDQLLAAAWGDDFDGNDRTVDVHVSRLRGKLPSLRERLVAVKGVGYRVLADGDLEKAG